MFSSSRAKQVAGIICFSSYCSFSTLTLFSSDQAKVVKSSCISIELNSSHWKIKLLVFFLPKFYWIFPQSSANQAKLARGLAWLELNLESLVRLELSCKLSLTEQFSSFRAKLFTSIKLYIDFGFREIPLKSIIEFLFIQCSEDKAELAEI